MNELELMLVCSIIAGVPYLGIYLSHKLSIKRIKEKLSKPTIDLDERVTHHIMPVLETEELYGITDTTYRGWSEYDNRNNPIPLRERYGGILEEKGDFIPKKKMKYHTLEEPIEYYSENEAGDEDEGCGCANVCDNCYDTTDYEYPF